MLCALKRKDDIGKNLLWAKVNIFLFNIPNKHGWRGCLIEAPGNSEKRTDKYYLTHSFIEHLLNARNSSKYWVGWGGHGSGAKPKTKMKIFD